MSFKKDDIAALYAILPDMVHGEDELHEGKSLHTALKFNFQIFNPNQIAKGNKETTLCCQSLSLISKQLQGKLLRLTNKKTVCFTQKKPTIHPSPDLKSVGRRRCSQLTD